MSAAVVAGEAVAAFPARIRQGCKGDGGIVEGATGLFVQEMDLCHHRDRSIVPGWGGLLFAGNLFLCMTQFTFGFVGLDPGEMGRVVCHVHRASAAWLGACHMFMLQGLEKPTMGCPILLCFHSVLIAPYSSQRVA